MAWPSFRRFRALVMLAGCVFAGACAATGASGTSGPHGPGSGVVVRVTDGDTIRVRVADRVESVRLIGIDTPETHGQGGLRECFGAEASRRARELLPVGAQVRLVRDVEARDRYGRLLAYVYRSDGTFVNLRLAEEGFAAALTIPPNVAHGDAISRAVASARDGDLGLWGRCGGPDTPIRRIAPLPSPP